MTYKKALELNESKAGLDIGGLSLSDLVSVINDLPGWDYQLADELMQELAERAGIDTDRYFAEPEYCDRAGCWQENPKYSEDEPHGFDYNDLFSDAAEKLGVDF